MIKINLNKKPRQAKLKLKFDIKKKHIFIYLLIPVVLGLLVVFLMQSVIQAQIANVNRKTTSYNNRISLIMPKVREVTAIKKTQTGILQKINVIKVLKKEQQGPIGYIYYVTEAVPKFAWINSLKSQNGSITINGIALDGQVVSIFMSNLQKTGFFRSINLMQTTEVKKQDLKLQNFSLYFGVNNK